MTLSPEKADLTHSLKYKLQFIQCSKVIFGESCVTLNLEFAQYYILGDLNYFKTDQLAK